MQKRGTRMKILVAEAPASAVKQATAKAGFARDDDDLTKT
jgi:hypothetical protein